MSDSNLQVQEKREVETRGEPTRDRPVFVPAVDIYETESNLTLVADMPGVGIDGVSIDVEKDQLTLRGTVGNGSSGDSNGSALLREYMTGDYYRQFNLSRVLDQAKIEATMKDGVLTVVLPKVEAAKPRRIDIKAA